MEEEPASLEGNRRRPVTAWPVLFYEEDGEKAVGDCLWYVLFFIPPLQAAKQFARPIFHYVKNKGKIRYSVRPLLLDAEKDGTEFTLAALLHLFKLHADVDSLDIAIRPLVLRLCCAYEEGKMSRFDVRLFWRILVLDNIPLSPSDEDHLQEFCWEQHRSVHLGLHPFCFSVTRSLNELDWYAFFGSIRYSSITGEENENFTRKFHMLPFLFHKGFPLPVNLPPPLNSHSSCS